MRKCLMEKLVLGLVSLLILSVGCDTGLNSSSNHQLQSQNADPLNDMFSKVLNNLLHNYGVGAGPLDDDGLIHPEFTGAWNNDPYGRAVAIAPKLLFSLARATGHTRYRDIGLRTVEYEMGLVAKVEEDLQNPDTCPEDVHEDLVRAYFGAPCLIDGFAETCDPVMKDYYSFILSFEALISIVEPDQFREILEPWVIPLEECAVTAYNAFVFADVLGDEAGEGRARLGKLVLDTTNEMYFDEETGRFEPFSLRTNAPMMMALAKGHKYFPNMDYLIRLEDTFTVIQWLLHDRSRGGFFAEPEDGAEARGRKKRLDSNNDLLSGLIALYKIKQKPETLGSIIDTLNFIREEMYDTDENQPDSKYMIVYEEWEEGVGHSTGVDSVFADSNFRLLWNLHRFTSTVGND